MVARSDNTWADSATIRALEIDAWRNEFERVQQDSVVEKRRRSRSTLVKRALVIADVLGLSLSLALTLALFGPETGGRAGGEILLFLLTVPAWLFLAGVHGLYGPGSERAEQSTVDELISIFQMVTIGTWLFVMLIGVIAADPIDVGGLSAFWALAIVFVTACRALARVVTQRLSVYEERTLILGAGDVGQLVARKICMHPEYGLRLMGFLDADPRARRSDVSGVEVIGGLESLERVSNELQIDRVIVAFSREPDDETMATLRGMRDRSVVIDVVPRLFDLIGSHSSIHTVEGMPLINVPPVRLSRFSFAVKRAADIIVGSALLLLTAPLFAYLALRVRLDSPGPVFFRQTRLSMDMEPFTLLKFRSMYVDTDERVHREFVESVSSSSASVGESGLYKLERADAVTPFGRWLRKTSLDELPQLLNVLRGDMSLVGPRPCIPYEVSNFKAHHLERFLVPQGITGLWQVSARANSTFGEALDMDVAYVRGWSLGLDARLALKTPFALIRQRKRTT